MEKEGLCHAEKQRYSRQLILPEINIEGQQKLKNASILVVGAGGLGSPVLLYLAAAGVGNIGIIDHDVVDKSNLHRQVIFTSTDVGRPKVEAAHDRIQALNPHTNITTFTTQLTADNALELIAEYDLVVDGTDNFPTRYLVNDACVLLNKPFVYASIYRFEGQVSVFNFLRKDGTRGPNYRDLFPVPPPPTMVPNCAEGGVLGVLPGILGTMQANEVIKIITNIGKPLDGRLFIMDALAFESQLLTIHKNPENPLTGNTRTQDDLIDYEQFCGWHSNDLVPSIEVGELKKMIGANIKFQLIDVRQPSEFELKNLGGKLIPQEKIEERIAEISKTKKVVVLCRSGSRSAAVIRLLQEKHGFTNLLNLKGGILAWEEMGGGK